MSMFRKFRSGNSSAAESRDAQQEDEADAGPPAPERIPFSLRSQSDPSQTQTLRAIPIGRGHSRSGSSTISEETLTPDAPSLPRSKTSVSPSGLVSRRTTVASISKDAEDPLGLVLVHGTSQSDADIIFVHGLGGSSRKTWSWDRNSDFFWPAWLKHEEGLANFRVFSYGYNANFKESDAPLSILDFAKDLLVWLKTYEHGTGSSIGPRPIVFVAHSMGGLVVKKALIIGKHDELYSGMLSKVHGIMFLSTPHKGSLHAKSLNSLLSVMVGASTKVYISELESSSTSIEDISEQFRAICSSWKLVSLYETLHTKFVTGVKKMIVNKDSGVLNYPQEISVPLNADHHTVCKYPDRLDQNYVLVVNLLKHMTEGLSSQSQESYVEKFQLQPAYTHEEDVARIEAILDTQAIVTRQTLDLHLDQSSEGSCWWLLKEPFFLQWRDSSSKGAAASGPPVLWLVGLPGTGKSTVAARTIDNTSRNFSCQYHFFSDSDASRRSRTNCLRSIALQLASEYPVFATALIQAHMSSKLPAVSHKFDSFWEVVFEDIIFKLDFGATLYWIIDGIDEADSPSALAKAFLNIKSVNPIRVLILSRPKRDLTSLAGGQASTVAFEAISQRHTEYDIREFIKAGVSEIFPQDSSRQDILVGRIADNAGGSFLWTRLVVESLRDNWHTEGHIDEVLRSTPKDMASMYEQMIGTIKKQSQTLQDLAFRILTWTCCSSSPLTVEELREALGTDWGQFTNLGETAVQVCGQFIRVHSQKISLIHKTAREFLIARRSGPTPPHVDLKAGHDHIAATCLSYLCRDEWRQVFLQVGEQQSSPTLDTNYGRLSSVYEEYPFLGYCHKNWDFGVARGSPSGPDLLPWLRLFFEKSVLSWIHGLALANSLFRVPRAAMSLKLWIRARRKHALRRRSLSLPDKDGYSDTTFIADWITDLTRIVTRFGPNLIKSPSSIHRLVPAFCPSGSIIARTYHRDESTLITIRGHRAEDWNDNLARLSLGNNDIASAVYAAHDRFYTLISHGGTVIAWSSDVCQEVRRFSHEEWVTMMSISKHSGNIATAGRHTYRVWDMRLLLDGRRSMQMCSIPRSKPGSIKSLDFANDDTALIVGYDDCSLISYDIETSKPSTLFIAQGQEAAGNCPSIMVLSPDQTKLLVGFRGKPILVYDISHLSRSGIHPPPRTIIRTDDRDRRATDVFNSPQVAIWGPDSCTLYILYHDSTILAYNTIEDTHIEHTATEARDMALDEKATLLVTSNHTGSLSVWALPKFNLVYRLHSHESVRALALSPNGSLIYDVRHSGCNVWAPDALLPCSDEDQIEEAETASSSFDGSYVSEAVSEPVVKTDLSFSGGQITAMIADYKSEYFVCGRDDGSVIIHEMSTGARARKVTAHATTAEVTVLAWTKSRKFMASADDCGKVIAKRLKIKEDGKWAVFPVFELRVEDAVRQLVFDEGESRLLVSTDAEDCLWDLKTKKEVCKRRRESLTGRWTNDWRDRERLIWVKPSTMSIHAWEDLRLLATLEDVMDPTALAMTPSAAVPSISVTPAPAPDEVIRHVIRPSESSSSAQQTFLITETHVKRNLVRPTDLSSRYDLVCFNKDGRVRRKPLQHIGAEIRQLLGFLRDRLVFLDHRGWICTVVLGWDMDGNSDEAVDAHQQKGPGIHSPRHVRHFFLPRDWIHDLSLSLLVLSEDGSLLCARNGEVSVVKYSKGL